MTAEDLGYVLHSRPYRETSQLLTLFTADHGRFNAIGRASRRQHAGNCLRPFCALRLAWRGKSELKTLASAEPLRSPALLAGDRLFVGLYLNELLARLLHEHEPHPELFQRYHQALEILGGGGEVEPVLRIFELMLLEDLGYGLELAIDMESGAPVEPGLRYVFFPGEGVRLHRAGERGFSLFSGEHLLAIAAGELDDAEVLKAAKQLTRQALGPYLGNKPLASRELFRARSGGDGAPGP
ncbi:MAG: DNA repair protein RecO [Porticoccaceae bacterium]|nr:DNA repair protein RecO [Pseudomonadota bacterium]